MFIYAHFWASSADIVHHAACTDSVHTYMYADSHTYTSCFPHWLWAFSRNNSEISREISFWFMFILSCIYWWLFVRANGRDVLINLRIVNNVTCCMGNEVHSICRNMCALECIFLRAHMFRYVHVSFFSVVQIGFLRMWICACVHAYIRARSGTNISICDKQTHICELQLTLKDFADLKVYTDMHVHIHKYWLNDLNGQIWWLGWWCLI